MSSILHQGRATYAFFERNLKLTKRYWAWEIVWLVYNVVNALSVIYLGAGAAFITGTKLNTQYLILYVLIGSCWYAIVHGILFTFVQLLVVSAFFKLDLSHANYLTAVFMLLIGSVSFIG